MFGSLQEDLWLMLLMVAAALIYARAARGSQGVVEFLNRSGDRILDSLQLAFQNPLAPLISMLFLFFVFAWSSVLLDVGWEGLLKLQGAQ
ncbi:MAG: hypothetical protein HY319_05485 [Armatimonadetes bacterium]|nr:hypothetical protein [Armatimonadota bacterium]